LPLPVGPVAIISPLGFRISSLYIPGSSSSSIVGTSGGSRRRARLMDPRCWATLQRRRPTPDRL